MAFVGYLTMVVTHLSDVPCTFKYNCNRQVKPLNSKSHVINSNHKQLLLLSGFPRFDSAKSFSITAARVCLRTRHASDRARQHSKTPHP